MSYQEIKEMLKNTGYSVRHFTRATYKTILQDRETARAMFENGESVQDFYRNSETAKTDFYTLNGGAYCKLLELLA